MRWWIGRHIYFLKGEDVAIGVAVMDLLLYIHVGSDDFHLVSVSVVSCLFILSLLCFVVVRVFRPTRFKVEPFVLPFLIIVNILMDRVHQVFRQAMVPLYFTMVVYCFLLTGYPYFLLLVFVLSGYLLGLLIQCILAPHVVRADVLYLGVPHWTDALFTFLYLILGSVMYLMVYELGLLILRYKKYPARSLQMFADLNALERLVLPAAYGCRSMKTPHPGNGVTKGLKDERSSSMVAVVSGGAPSAVPGHGTEGVGVGATAVGSLPGLLRGDGSDNASRSSLQPPVASSIDLSEPQQPHHRRQSLVKNAAAAAGRQRTSPRLFGGALSHRPASSSMHIFGSRRSVSSVDPLPQSGSDRHPPGIVLRNNFIQKNIHLLPICLVKFLILLDRLLEICKKRRFIMGKATWRHKTMFMPKRSKLSVFSDDKHEGWYVQWMQGFNCRLYFKLRWIYPMIVLWHILYCSSTRARAIIAMRLQPDFPADDYASVLWIIRVISQALIQGGLCLPMLIFKNALKNSAHAYKFNLIMLAQAIFAFSFSAWDSVAFSNPDFMASADYRCVASPVIGMYLSSVFLLTRVPPFFLLTLVSCLLYAVPYWTVGTKTAADFVMVMAHMIMQGIGILLLFVRSFDQNRRRVFSKFVLPYVLYLEEVAYIVYGPAAALS